MEIIDGQLHEFGPILDWEGRDELVRRDMLTEVMLEAMEAAGVHGAALQPAEDITWAVDCAAMDPDRFAVVPMITGADVGGANAAIHPDDPDLEDAIVSMAERPGVKAFRLLVSSIPTELPRLSGGGYDQALKICQDQALPVFLCISGRPELAGPVAEAFPELPLVIDHLGLVQPPSPVPDPWDEKLATVLELARHPNLHIKYCGLPGFSTEAFPYDDVRPQAEQLVEAYGADRLLWASDISRFQGRIGWKVRYPNLFGDYPGKHTYAQSVDFIKDATWLDESQKAEILAGTVRRLLAWPVA